MKNEGGSDKFERLIDIFMKMNQFTGRWPIIETRIN